MTFDKQYWINKKMDLIQKANKKSQEYINQAFSYVADQTDLSERIQEIDRKVAELEPIKNELSTKKTDTKK